MSRPHDPADMRDLLLEALDETGRRYNEPTRPRLLSTRDVYNETARACIEINGHIFEIQVIEVMKWANGKSEPL
jgi:hypothetical protein